MIPVITADGQLHITAQPGSSPHDFDFLLGSWRIYNRKLVSRLTNCQDWQKFEARGELRILLQGAANIDSFKADLDGHPFEAMTLRLFNPANHLWSIYWADSNSVTLDKPVVGSFDGDEGRFYAIDQWQGHEVLLTFKWDKTNPREPNWSQAFSIDQGKTWEWNWFMNFYKID